jgi:acyl-CoA thioesterase YciA
MRLKLEVWVKPVLRANEAQRYCVTEGIFTYVAIDDQGKSRPVPV